MRSLKNPFLCVSVLLLASCGHSSNWINENFVPENIEYEEYKQNIRVIIDNEGSLEDFISLNVNQEPFMDDWTYASETLGAVDFEWKTWYFLSDASSKIEIVPTSVNFYRGYKNLNQLAVLFDENGHAHMARLQRIPRKPFGGWGFDLAQVYRDFINSSLPVMFAILDLSNRGEKVIEDSADRIVESIDDAPANLIDEGTAELERGGAVDRAIDRNRGRIQDFRNE